MKMRTRKKKKKKNRVPSSRNRLTDTNLVTAKNNILLQCIQDTIDDY